MLRPSIYSELIISKAINLHYANRYLKFIGCLETMEIKDAVHMHHILPKAKDMFPQFRDLRQHSWNGIKLTHRQHWVAHWLLSKAIGGSQRTAFFRMTKKGKTRITSKTYTIAKELHAEQSRQFKHTEETKKLLSEHGGHAKGKTYEEIIGPERAKELKQLKSEQKKGNKGWPGKRSEEFCKAMSECRIGVPHTAERKANISKAKTGKGTSRKGGSLSEQHKAALRKPKNSCMTLLSNKKTYCWNTAKRLFPELFKE